MRKLSLLLISILAWCVFAQDTAPHFVETGECQGEQLCSYSHSAEQHYQDDEENPQKTQVNATVDITCTSSGEYNGSEAKLYCMSVKNAKYMSYTLENATAKDMKELQQSLNNQLNNWFCFVQSASGKIPAVYHSPSEPAHVVSFKKAIAAAFQANFEGTEEEEETDAQSQHKSHYTYTPTEEDGVVKMHRSIRKSDITDDISEDIDSSTDEDIQYRSGKLERSSGSTSFHVVNNSDSNTDEDEELFSLSQTLSGSGSYSMDLQSCRKVNRYAFGVQKRKIFAEMSDNSKEEGLRATIDEEQEAMEQMKILRAKLPAGSALRALQNSEAYGDKLFKILTLLLQLESQYGTLQSYTPVIDETLAFIQTMMELDTGREFREDVVMLLTVDGSLKSQMAILAAFDNAEDIREANSILTHISLMETARTGFVIGMEERLNRPNQDPYISGQLLLVFGSLATKGSEEVENRVMNYLSAKVSDLQAKTEIDLDAIDLLLRALGNTGSKQSIAFIFDILDSSIDHADFYEIKLIAIDSLVKLTDNPTVLTRLESMLTEDPTPKCAFAILDTLIDAYEYVALNKEALPQYLSYIKAHTLLHTLAETVASSNVTSLHQEMEHYLKKIKADDDLFAMIYVEGGPLGSRAKRGTDWDAHHSDYNLVSSLSERQSDVRNYPHHQAYLWTKTFGVDQANVKFACGFFAGGGQHCDRAKGYGRARVEGKLLDRRFTIADVKVEVRATTTSAYIDVYVRIAGNTLFSYHFDQSLSSPCKLYTRNLAEYNRRIFSFRHNIFIYVGYLTLTVHVDIQFRLDLNCNLCIGRTGTEVTGALGAITPRVCVVISGGVTGNLLELARGGVQISASCCYQPEPAVSIQGCQAHCSVRGRACIGIYDSFPECYIDLETWYQTRTVRWCSCGSWCPGYPCVRWGSRNRVGSLSARWNLDGQSRRPLFQRCLGSIHPVCAASVFDSPLFSY